MPHTWISAEHERVNINLYPHALDQNSYKLKDIGPQINSRSYRGTINLGRDNYIHEQRYETSQKYNKKSNRASYLHSPSSIMHRISFFLSLCLLGFFYLRVPLCLLMVSSAISAPVDFRLIYISGIFSVVVYGLSH